MVNQDEPHSAKKIFRGSSYNSLSGLDSDHESPTITSPASGNRITMVTTTRLAKFSVERYYMLAEIDQKAYTPIFMDNYDVGENFDIGDCAASPGCIELRRELERLPSHIVVYFLWRKDISSHLFLDLIESSMGKFFQSLELPHNKNTEKNLSENSCKETLTDESTVSKHIHLVVDRISPLDEDTERTKEADERHHAEEVKVVENFSRIVAKSRGLRQVFFA